MAGRTGDFRRGLADARCFNAGYKNQGDYRAIVLSLKVEHETGQVPFGRAAAGDSGQLINPGGIRNQIAGAIVRSASWPLHEMVRFDRSWITSTDWSGYPIMRCMPVPESIAVHIAPCPTQPFLGTGVAGQGRRQWRSNGVRNATGIRIRDLPLTPFRLKWRRGLTTAYLGNLPGILQTLLREPHRALNHI